MRLDRLDDGLEFDERARQPAGLAERQPAQQRDAVVQLRENLTDDLIPATLEQDRVEGVLCRQQCCGVGRRGGRVQVLKRGPQSCHLLVAGVAREALAGQPLQAAAHLVDGAGLVQIDGRDQRALVRDDADQPLGLQVLQRFTQHRPADAEGLPEFAFHQPLARREPAGQDRRAQPVGGLVA